MLLLSRHEVESVLDLNRLLDALAPAMVDLSSGRASMPLRVAALVEERHALLAAMPAYLPSSRTLSTKLVSLFPDNRDRPTHQALICCFDPEHGSPVALMDGTYITAARTAAGSALATRLLARPESRAIAVIGTGEQARAHARALAGAWPADVIRIAGRDPEKARALAAELRPRVQVAIEAVATIADAVRGADIVCACTHAAEPVVRREWLAEGTHVNSVGYNAAGAGEVDVDTVRIALVVVESRAAALAAPPAGAVELRLAVDAGAIDAGHIRAEIGELIAKRAQGRTDPAQITLYKSVGVAVQDAAAAGLVLAAAAAAGVGRQVDI